MISAPLVAVEFDLYDGTTTRTLYLSSSTLTAVVDGVPVHYVPLLDLPIGLGSRVAGEQYGGAARATANGGVIEFKLAGNDGNGSQIDLWPYLGYAWRGRPFRVRLGTLGDGYDDLALVYEGRIDDFTHDGFKVSVRTGDVSIALDKPLIAELYGIVLGSDVSGTTVTDAPGAGTLFLRRVVADQDASLKYVSIVPSADSDTARFRPLVYADASGSQGGLLLTGEVVTGCNTGVPLTAPLTATLGITQDTAYWLGYMADTAIALALEDAALNDGVKASINFAGGAPWTLPVMTANRPAWLIWGDNVYAGDPPAPAPSSIVGKPKPRLYGTCYNVEPLLEDQGNLVYRISDRALAGVLGVRVGSIAWDYAASDPQPGEWTLGPGAGQITLGAVTLGADVRVDARSSAYAGVTTAALFRDIVEGAGGVVDAAAMTALATARTGLLGFHAADPLNILDMLDQVAVGTGCYWCASPSGLIAAYAIAAPADDADIALAAGGADGDIASLALVQNLSRVWRLRVEYRRNWNPSQSFEPFVSPADQARYRAAGLIAPPYKDASVKEADSRAVDILVRSLFVEEADAIALRDALVEAWGVTRKIYNVTAFIPSAAVNLYDTVSLDYLGVSGNFRVIGLLLPIGGGAVQLQVWG